jgi:hypothetical protein
LSFLVRPLHVDFCLLTQISDLRDECKDEWIIETGKQRKKEKESREIERRGEINIRRKNEKRGG